jgi:hypothetical protein
MFQSTVTVDNESEDDSNTDNEEEREYSIEIIEGVRYLKYHVVVPPDAPTENDTNNGNANETQESNGNANVNPDHNTRANTAQPIAVHDALQSSSVEPYTWGEGRFEPKTWGRQHNNGNAMPVSK